jgi:hypothetical protein
MWITVRRPVASCDPSKSTLHDDHKNPSYRILRSPVSTSMGQPPGSRKVWRPPVAKRRAHVDPTRTRPRAIPGGIGRLRIKFLPSTVEAAIRLILRAIESKVTLRRFDSQASGVIRGRRFPADSRRSHIEPRKPKIGAPRVN